MNIQRRRVARWFLYNHYEEYWSRHIIGSSHQGWLSSLNNSLLLTLFFHSTKVTRKHPARISSWTASGIIVGRGDSSLKTRIRLSSIKQEVFLHIGFKPWSAHAHLSLPLRAENALMVAARWMALWMMKHLAWCLSAWTKSPHQSYQISWDCPSTVRSLLA